MWNTIQVKMYSTSIFFARVEYNPDKNVFHIDFSRPCGIQSRNKCVPGLYLRQRLPSTLKLKRAILFKFHFKFGTYTLVRTLEKEVLIMKQKKFIKILALSIAASLALSIAACSKTENTTATSQTTAESTITETTTAESSSEESTETESTAASETVVITADDIRINEEITNSNDSEHAVEASGETAAYSNVKVTKTGDSDEGDKADFYGDNSAVFATDGATLTLTNIIVDTDGTHANAVFSYGEGTTVNISDSVITTSGNCSGGIMTTGGGTMNATNLNIHTTGNSSAAIRSDRGGGTVNVNGGVYLTDGKGSPAIYSTADITVSDATLESTASQGVVVEGRNSVTLNNVTLIADNNTKNSDKSEWYQAVMIYQSMSGDAAEGLATFT